MTLTAESYIKQENRYCANNYHPLPVVLSKGEGVWLWDLQGKRYLDLMSAYSAVSFGHSHPALLNALHEQSKRLNLCSRAFYHDQLAPFLKILCEVTGLPKALPMNTGTEAVETAIKAARRWGYRVKGIPHDHAEIIVAQHNFHGRTTGIIGFSSDENTYSDFGPYSTGFKSVPFDDVSAIEASIIDQTCAVLLEPIQGEAGVLIPKEGYLAHVQRLCQEHHVLLILDEVQSGLGRTGRWFGFQHENIVPDGLIVGKALGGGIIPVSAFLAKEELMNVFNVGSHGSTFGGNALAASVGRCALELLQEGSVIQNSADLGEYALNRLRAINSPALRAVRGKGLWIGLDLDTRYITGRAFCEKLLAKGVLAKETHEKTIRIAPPLVISQSDLDFGLDRIIEILLK